jgi:pyrroloquinoline quinone biosynthesis protein B
MTIVRIWTITFALALQPLLPAPALADDTAPYLYVLGVAQDAGYPQAGCYRPHCLPGWAQSELRRTVVSLGLVDPGAGRKYLFEATPNLPEQLYELQTIAPDNEYTLGGVFLTHAHIGHYTGLMYFGHEAMGAKEIPVFAMPRMRDYLGSNGPWSQLVAYRNIELLPIENAERQSFGTLSIAPFLVPHRDEYSETVGYRITGPNRSALFIPDIDKWSKWDRQIAELVREVDYALLDATFFDGDELPDRDMSSVPHPFVVESMALFGDLPAAERKKIWFIHFNHSNPLLDPDSLQSQQVRERGFNIAMERLRLDL